MGMGLVVSLKQVVACEQEHKEFSFFLHGGNRAIMMEKIIGTCTSGSLFGL
jgi:hypothetical protein